LAGWFSFEQLGHFMAHPLCFDLLAVVGGRVGQESAQIIAYAGAEVNLEERG
jgi:hypothetical protein